MEILKVYIVFDREQVEKVFLDLEKAEEYMEENSIELYELEEHSVTL
jgi:hypothetical protein